MASMEGETLESLLNRATNPMNRDEDWEYIMGFCDQVNKELEGPQIAVRLIAHKIQSPQEKEAIYALVTLESCVKNCGKRFHQEIGKFRFLNEIIKVVSPKYLGTHTTEAVKNHCIEMLYSWSQGLKEERKIEEAYQMLKKQGIVTKDPVHVDRTFEPPPPVRAKNTIFDDEDKSKMLARLLRSKHPEDLQAANRLIKNMVKQDAERIEKVSKRMTDLETVSNNIKLLSEMLAVYCKDSTGEADKDIMKELYDNLEKQRPNLFRLASDTDEKDSEGIASILKVNDDVVKVMSAYRRLVEGSSEENGIIPGLSDTAPTTKTTDSGEPSNNLDSLEDLFSTNATVTDPQASPGTLLNLAMNSTSHNVGASGLIDSNQSVVSSLDDMLLTGTNTNTSAAATTTSLMDQPPLLPAPSAGMGNVAAVTTLQQPSPSLHPVQQLGNTNTTTAPLLQATSRTAPLATTTNATLPPMQSQPYKTNASLYTSDSTSVSWGNTESTSAKATAPLAPQTTAFDDLDILGKSRSNIPETTKSPQLNQLAAAGISTKPLLPTASATPLSVGGAPIPTPTAAPPITTTVTGSSEAVASKSPSPAPVEPINQLFVKIEDIKPGEHPPINAYDKDGLKIVIHIAKDRPRADVMVLVVSTMSTNIQPITKYNFLAAVPKVMRVKLQPPSATDLPAYNPILPPAAITQVMLIANPNKEKIRLKYKLSYLVGSVNHSDVGDIDSFPI